MKALVNAVQTSIAAAPGVDDTGWTYEKSDPIWRNPTKGKVCNIYAGPTRPGAARWTGSVIDIHSVIVEYTESSGTQATTLKRDEAAELAAYDVADSIRTWALGYEEGFSPAHKMDCVRIDYAPQTNRQLFVRYCRLTLEFEVVKSFT